MNRKVAMQDAPRITVDELKRRLDSGEEFTFLDVRNPQAWADSDVKLPGAVRMTPDTLEQKLSRIPKAKPIVAYCT
jgi:rhodanese-related sulfurtransferase